MLEGAQVLGPGDAPDGTREANCISCRLSSVDYFDKGGNVAGFWVVLMLAIMATPAALYIWTGHKETIARIQQEGACTKQHVEDVKPL